MSKKGRVFSGARPTGRQHLGNYLGAIKNYVALQDEYECVYCIVDLHALTTVEDTENLRQNTHEMALDWLAAGIRPDESIVFVQSHVPEVTEHSHDPDRSARQEAPGHTQYERCRKMWRRQGVSLDDGVMNAYHEAQGQRGKP